MSHLEKTAVFTGTLTTPSNAPQKGTKYFMFNADAKFKLDPVTGKWAGLDEIKRALGFMFKCIGTKFC